MQVPDRISLFYRDGEPIIVDAETGREVETASIILFLKSWGRQGNMIVARIKFVAPNGREVVTTYEAGEIDFAPHSQSISATMTRTDAA